MLFLVKDIRVEIAQHKMWPGRNCDEAGQNCQISYNDLIYTLVPSIHANDAATTIERRNGKNVAQVIAYSF